MNTDTQDAQDFRALAMTALRITGNMLADATPEVQQAIDRALNGGSRFELCFSVPNIDVLKLVLVEPEGMRRTVATVAINHAQIQ